MRRQRIAGYKPELVVLPPKLSLGPSQLGRIWTSTSNLYTGEGAHSESVVIECINIGVGVARNVVATWEFDRQFAVEQLSPLLADRGFSIWHGEEDGCSKIEFEDGTEPRMSVAGDLSAGASVPYLLPAQAPENVFLVPLPPDFLLLLGLYLSFSHDDSWQLMMLQRLPPLFLSVSFLDAGGARRNSKVELRFRLTHFESREESDGHSETMSAEATASVISSRRRWLK